jgi:type III secretory pathway component EscV
VEGQVLQHSDEDLRSVYCWVTGSPIRADITPAGILTQMLAWLSRARGPDASKADRDKLASLLTQISLAITKLQPSVLLGQAQVADYIASLPVPETEGFTRWPPDEGWLSQVPRQVLSLGISIADRQAVAETLAPHVEGSSLDASEILIDVLRPEAIEIHVEREYLRQLTTVDADNRSGCFASLRDGMYAELGISYPAFRLVPDARLGPRQFMFKLNHLAWVPQVGLGPEECLVNDTPEALKLFNPASVMAANPASGQPNSITNLEHKSVLEATGYTTWDQMGYLILSQAAMLRRHGECIVGRQFAEHQLRQLEGVFPAVVKTANSATSVAQITAVLRNLVAEEISLRNLRLILERISDYQFRDDAGRPVVVDDAAAAFEVEKAIAEDDVAQLTRFVRAGLKGQIGGKHSRGTNTVVVYLMSPAIEELISDYVSTEQSGNLNVRLAGAQQEQILEAIRMEIRHLPPTAQIPCILTTSEIRHALRDTIALEFPRIPVIGYEEILPGLNIQPIARISWSTPANA